MVVVWCRNSTIYNNNKLIPLTTELWFDVGHEDKNQQVIEHDQVDVINNIEPLIKVIRGHQVMLDRDLARLYGVETGQLNKQVKRGYKLWLKPPCNHAFIFSISNKERTPCLFIPHPLSQNRELIPSSHRSKDRLWRKTRCDRGWWRDGIPPSADRWDPAGQPSGQCR